METNFWSVFPVVGCNPIVIISRVVGKRFDSFTLHQTSKISCKKKTVNSPALPGGLDKGRGTSPKVIPNTKATTSTRVDGNRPMRDCVGCTDTVLGTDTPQGTYTQ
jgi:hypothetical protein